VNRRELFLQPVTLVWRNKTLWPIALIGLAISAILNVLSLVDPAFGLAGLFMAFMTIAFTNGALITMVNVIADGEPVGVIDGLRAGALRLMPLLAVNVAVMLPTWIALVFMTGSVGSIFSQLGRHDLLQATNMLDVAGAMLSLTAIIIAANAIGAAIGVGAERAIVLEDKSIVPALQRGWQLVRTRFADYFMIAAVLFGLGLAVSLLFAVGIGPVLLSIFVPSALQESGGAAAITAFYSGPGIVIYILVNLVIMSLITAYTSSVWTFAFRSWKSEEEQRDE
jgi:hypothetical protein